MFLIQNDDFLTHSCGFLFSSRTKWKIHVGINLKKIFCYRAIKIKGTAG